MMATARRAHEPVVVHEDEPAHYGDSTEDDTEEMDESRDPLEESGGTISEEDSDEEVEDSVVEDINKFEASFKNITKRYRLINRIGEGTFSTVYKAEDLLYDQYENEWDSFAEKENVDTNASVKQSSKPSKARYVAIKKIYVTSSPQRIFNELDLLYDLRNSANVCPLITAFRDQDQVIAVLPYFQHRDFRDYYREFTIDEMRMYFRSLFTALTSVHACEIIHRDIKPTNFLYSPSQQRGVLVDFGLAEREGTDNQPCDCRRDERDRARKVSQSVYSTSMAAAHVNGQPPPRPTYPKDDHRSSRRANRAGTRGFRAPEVLLKCTAQTCLIDVWSVGIILLTFLSKRFPFFHSADDIDAFIELCSIFGKKKMAETALLHGQVLQTNIPTISDNGHSWEKILLWCLGRSKRDSNGGLTEEEYDAVAFMQLCLELNPAKRITAEEALEHPWLAIGSTNTESDMMAEEA